MTSLPPMNRPCHRTVPNGSGGTMHPEPERRITVERWRHMGGVCERTRVELKDYWLTVRRRWRVIVLCVAVCVGAAAYTWQATPLYSSTASIFVSTSPSDTADAYQGNLFATQRVASYAAARYRHQDEAGRASLE